jgi:hypothetical protein
MSALARNQRPRLGARTPLADIREWLHEGGYGHLAPRAAEIREAAGTGCLLWTKERLTTTNGSRIDARPEC